jgi:citrate lyase subunit beta/citryl-CoA lyase
VVEAAAAAKDKGVGAFTVGGRMVDAPFIRRAERILEVARRLGLVAQDERRVQ